jgi:dolichyl-phosphate beta-glucosyltransferase
MPDPFLTIVVPAYNEARRIGPSLIRILQWAGALTRPVEVIVVDDGSTDDTARVAREALGGFPRSTILRNEGNRGKGYSIRRGVLAARAPFVLVSDADLSTPIEEAGRLLERLEATGRGMVIGSRALRESRVEIHQNAVREMMGRIFNRVVRLLTGLPFHDTQCGFKLMARRDVAPIFERARIDGFSYDVELLYVAVRRGIPVTEVGVTWRNAPGSKVGMLSDPLRMLRDVWRVRRWYARGDYEVRADDKT